MTQTTPSSGSPGLPGPGEPWTPIGLTRWSGEYLKDRGVENGRLDAEHLLARVLGVQRLGLYLQFDRPLQPGELKEFKSLLLRRAAREPLQYILGITSFRELELATDRRALIPRPETEILVGEVLSWAWAATSESRVNRPTQPAQGAVSGDLRNPLAALDVGTGTGAIALSLLREGPFHHVVATDPSSEALNLARENAIAHGLEKGVDLRAGSWFEAVGPDERFDVIVSNPPYVPAGDRTSLAPEIRDWEPLEALIAGEDGLQVLVRLVAEAGSHLEEGGLFAVEVGDGQASAVAERIEGTGGFRDLRIARDLTGHERIVMANRG